MKAPESSHHFLTLLLLVLTLTLQPVTSSDTISRKIKAEIFTTRHAAQLPITNIPELSDFTVCLDLSSTSDAPWTLFSYCIENGKQGPELGFARDGALLQIYLRGVVYNVQKEIGKDTWHTLCLTLSSVTTQLEAYLNGERFFNGSAKGGTIKGQGSLVVGAGHTRKAGVITLVSASSFVGSLYNYQMWNYARTQNELSDCAEGNIMSWTKESWNFANITVDEELRCASVIDKPSSTEATSVISTTSMPTVTSTSTTNATSNSTEPPDSKFTSSKSSSSTISSASNVTTSGVTITTTTTPIRPSSPSSPVKTTTTALDTLTSSSTIANTTSTLLSTPSPASSEMTGSLLTNTTTSESSTSPEQTTTGAQSVTSRNPEDFTTNNTTSNSTEAPDGSQTVTSRNPEDFTINNGTSISTTPSDEKSTSSKSSLPTIPTSSNVTTVTITSTTTPSINTSSPPSPAPTTTTTPKPYTSSSTIANTTSTDLSTPSPLVTNTTTSESSQSPGQTTTGFTITATSQSSNITGQTTTVSFYIVYVSTKVFGTDVVIDGNAASSLMKSMMDSFLYNTAFSVIDIVVSDALSCSSTLIISANSSESSDLLQSQLKGHLENKTYTDKGSNISLSIQAVNIAALDLQKCPDDVTSYQGEFFYTWTETNPTETATLPCHTDQNEFATRHCAINVTTTQAEWETPDLTKCFKLPSLPNSFEDLNDVVVTPENAKYLSEHILNMTKNVTFLPPNDIKIILGKVSEIIDLGNLDVENAKIHLDVINDIIAKAEGSLPTFTNQILNITERIGFTMSFAGETANITASSMAILVTKANFTEFEELHFTVTSYQNEKEVEMTTEKPTVHNPVASISLPRAIKDQNVPEVSKVQFNFFGNLSLFKDFSRKYELATYVISASVEGVDIKNLKQPVEIWLQHIRNVENYPRQCAFWDFTMNNHTGGWSTDGCHVQTKNEDYTLCHCTHLTHFGVLLDISGSPINPLDDHILTLLTYVGCGIASLFLGVVLVTYGMFRQLRRDYPSKILMNLSFSLLMLNLSFLVNDWLASFSNHALCISIASILHYFLLTSFTWMGLESIHMYFAFVKVFNSYIHKYILKLSIAGWGIPAAVVGVVLCINVNFYGNKSDVRKYSISDDSSSSFCWIQNQTVFYVSVVAYFVIVFLTNISMFIVVLLQIKSLKSTREKDWKALFLHDIKNTLSLAFLLGLTWGFAFFAWGPVRIAFFYLFAIFNTMQGFFIFVFHCLIKENVRKHWRMHLCCGRCQPDNYSDWSRLSNVDTKYPGRLHMSPSDSYNSTKSNNTTSTSNASSLSGFSRDGYYGRSNSNGGIFINLTHNAPSNRIYPDTKRTFLD